MSFYIDAMIIIPYIEIILVILSLINPKTAAKFTRGNDLTEQASHKSSVNGGVAAFLEWCTSGYALNK